MYKVTFIGNDILNEGDKEILKINMLFNKVGSIWIVQNYCSGYQEFY